MFTFLDLLLDMLCQSFLPPQFCKAAWLSPTNALHFVHATSPVPLFPVAAGGGNDNGGDDGSNQTKLDN